MDTLNAQKTAVPASPRVPCDELDCPNDASAAIVILSCATRDNYCPKHLAEFAVEIAAYWLIKDI